MDGIGDEGLERYGLVPLPLASKLSGDVDVLDALVTGQDAQGRGIGGELIVAVGEARVVLVLDLGHGLQLPLDLHLDLLHDLVQEGNVARHLLAQDHEHRSLDVVPFLERRFGLRGYGPGGGHPQPRGPEDEREVRPHRGVLMGEHHHLQPVVGHVGREVAVGVHHAPAELVARAADGERPLAVDVPIFDHTSRDAPPQGEPLPEYEFDQRASS